MKLLIMVQNRRRGFDCNDDDFHNNINPKTNMYFHLLGGCDSFRILWKP